MSFSAGYIGYDALPSGGGNSRNKVCPGIWTMDDAILLTQSGFWATPTPLDAPTLSVDTGDGSFDLSWTVPSTPQDAPVIEYNIEYSISGIVSNVLTASTGTSYQLTNLVVSGEYDLRIAAINIDGQGLWSTLDTFVAASGAGINEDNIARITTASDTTSITVNAESTIGYYKLVSSDGQTSSVAGSSNPWYMYSMNIATISNMPTGSEKTIQVIACDANGVASGELEYISLISSTQPLKSLDFSGCTSLRGFNVNSNSSNYMPYMNYQSSSLPSGIESVRCVGVSGFGGGYYPGWGGNINYHIEGIGVAGQNLTASALDQLYTDLGSTNNGYIFVNGNPGTSTDTPSIATNKGYIVYGT